MSTYEGEHTIFGFLSQANLTQNDVLQFHPFTSQICSSQVTGITDVSHCADFLVFNKKV
jgi:hypothetical protein